MFSEDEQASLSTESPVFAHHNKNNNKGSREAVLKEFALRRLMPSLGAMASQWKVTWKFSDSHRL
jgi:hypothetical protein